MKAPLIVLGVLTAMRACAAGLEPWASNSDLTDTARSHIEKVGAARHEYAIEHGGTMDGFNCRSPIGYAAWRQTWESNRAVRLENVGETDVVNPWLSNGRNNFRTIEEIVEGYMWPGMSEAEKAISIWRGHTQHRFHAYTADNEVNDPVKVYNVYGYTLCGNDAICLAGLWRTAGLQVRPARPQGHVVTEVFYDGRWHLLDGDEHCIFLLRDNETIADEQEIVRDHDLIKRTHTYGILQRDDRNLDEFSASLYVYDGEPGGSRDSLRDHSMSMTLRPGEALTWRWGRLEPYKYHGLQDIKDWGQHAVDKVCNGLWEYRPDLSGALWRRGAESVEGIVAGEDGLRAEEGRTGVVVWQMRSPYVFVGGRLEAQGEGARFSLSWDGADWSEVGADLDAFFPPAGPARYRYFLRCELSGDARLGGLAIINDVQMAPLSLPGMVVGENRFVYTDETPGERQVRITHEWVERSSSRPPEAPPAPVFPPDGAEVEGTRLTFRWETPADPDGHAIADYHFELSNRPDMKWPLSPNFEKLISNTVDAGQAQYTLPYVGLLTPDRVYYWRVRAKDAAGVWGPWSATWRFTPRGPAPPVNVRLEFDEPQGVGILRWDANPVGRRPVKYFVYGSDEKGFTVSDEPYMVNVGNQPEKLPTPFSANLVAETPNRELTVVVAGMDLPRGNKAFYRVVAVDERGNRSWSSDYAEAPRPLIYSAPPATARVGTEWRYQLAVIRSLGDLRCRTINGKSYNANFWDIEQPRFTLVQGPDWLTLDPETGLLTGVPPAAGAVEVAVRASIDGAGEATQRFAITVLQ